MQPPPKQVVPPPAQKKVLSESKKPPTVPAKAEFASDMDPAGLCVCGCVRVCGWVGIYQHHSYLSRAASIIVHACISPNLCLLESSNSWS